jgi:hypothetical protein
MRMVLTPFFILNQLPFPLSSSKAGVSLALEINEEPLAAARGNAQKLKEAVTSDLQGAHKETICMHRSP